MTVPKQQGQSRRACPSATAKIISEKNLIRINSGAATTQHKQKGSAHKLCRSKRLKVSFRKFNLKLQISANGLFIAQLFI